MSELILAVAQSIARPGDVAGSVMDHVSLASRAADQGAQIVVFPELSLTGYDRGLAPSDALATSDPCLQPFQAAADPRAMIVIPGAPLPSGTAPHIGAIRFTPRRGPQA